MQACSMNQGEVLRIRKSVSVEGYYVSEFQALREHDGVSSDVVLASLCPERNQSSVFKAGEASGASGSFFFFSADKRFIVKTMTS